VSLIFSEVIHFRETFFLSVKRAHFKILFQNEKNIIIIEMVLKNCVNMKAVGWVKVQLA